MRRKWLIVLFSWYQVLSKKKAMLLLLARDLVQPVSAPGWRSHYPCIPSPYWMCPTSATRNLLLVFILRAGTANSKGSTISQFSSCLFCQTFCIIKVSVTGLKLWRNHWIWFSGIIGNEGVISAELLLRQKPKLGSDNDILRPSISCWWHWMIKDFFRK